MRQKLSIVLISLLFSINIYATTYPMPIDGGDIVGQDFTVKIGRGDTLIVISQKYGIGLQELLEANPKLDPNRLHVGQTLTIPTRFILPQAQYRDGIVINIAELRLYYFNKNGTVMTYPVGLGKIDWRTPTTNTYVIRKEVDPTWHVPKSIQQYTFDDTGEILPDEVAPGPENPLGPRAMYLGLTGYLIHGNNNPNSIGQLVSSGCIRMHNEDVLELYNYIEKGTPVHIINHANKAGWDKGQLYLESHHPVFLDEEPSPLNYMPMELAIENATLDRPVDIDWVRASSIGYAQIGIPQVILHQ